MIPIANEKGTDLFFIAIEAGVFPASWKWAFPPAGTLKANRRALP